MCGIIGGRVAAIKEKGLPHLWNKLKHRGTDSYGMLFYVDGVWDTYKALSTRSVIKKFKKLPDDTYVVLHNRAASIGKVTIDLAHPLTVDTTTVIHNGTNKDLYTNHMWAASDTEAMAHGLSITDNWYGYFELVGNIGIGVVFVVDSRWPSMLYMRRDEIRPLWLETTSNVLASEPIFPGTWELIAEKEFIHDFTDTDSSWEDALEFTGTPCTIKSVGPLQYCTVCGKRHYGDFTSTGMCYQCSTIGKDLPVTKYSNSGYNSFKYEEYDEYDEWPAYTNVYPQKGSIGAEYSMDDMKFEVLAGANSKDIEEKRANSSTWETVTSTPIEWHEDSKYRFKYDKPRNTLTLAETIKLAVADEKLLFERRIPGTPARKWEAIPDITLKNMRLGNFTSTYEIFEYRKVSATTIYIVNPSPKQISEQRVVPARVHGVFKNTTAGYTRVTESAEGEWITCWATSDKDIIDAVTADEASDTAVESWEFYVFLQENVHPTTDWELDFVDVVWEANTNKDVNNWDILTYDDEMVIMPNV